MESRRAAATQPSELRADQGAEKKRKRKEKEKDLVLIKPSPYCIMHSSLPLCDRFFFFSSLASESVIGAERLAAFVCVASPASVLKM